MKKLVILLVALFAVSATAAGIRATLINSRGDKVVVASGSAQAQDYFSKGYVLMGGDFTAPGKVEKVCDCDMIGGQLHTSREFFSGGLTSGGSVYATSSYTDAWTITSREMPTGVSIINWTPQRQGLTVTLTATATKSIIPNIGDTAVVYMKNASTTAASTITLAADATGNVDLQKANYTGADLVIDGNDYDKLTFIRTTATKIAVIVESLTEGD